MRVRMAPDGRSDREVTKRNKGCCIGAAIQRWQGKSVPLWKSIREIKKIKKKRKKK
jgi:hypothetical protein